MDASRARRSAVLALALLSLACASWPPGAPSPEPGRGHPTLWCANQAGAGDIALLGSVHLGGPEPLALGAAFERAWERSEELVLEVDFGRYDDRAAARLMDRYGRVPTPATLRDRVSPRTWELLRAYLEARRMPARPLLAFQPWMVATLIAVREFRALGYDPEHGVDRVLMERARAAGKPVRGVETLESQFAMLGGLPERVQDLMLRDMLERADDFPAEATAMLAAWRDGRDGEMARITFRQQRNVEFAPFYESVLFGRNRRMADAIADLSRDGRPRLMVVGAAHMLGERGLPALLEERGFDVEVCE